MTIDLFSYRNECCSYAQETRKSIIEKLKQEATRESDVNMEDGQAMLETLNLINWGLEGFEHDFSQFHKNDPRIESLVDALVRANRHYFKSEFFTSGTLQNILQGKH